MLTVEKTLLLKNAELFQEIADESLASIAALLEEQSVEAGTTLFDKGEPGHALYVIAEGSVKVHDGNHELAVLHENDFFGELSLLDAEPRSASITTLSDCLLLRLEQAVFYEAVALYPDVLKGIVRTLCRRLRRMDAKLTGNS